MFYWHWFLKIVRRSVGTAMIVHYNRETALWNRPKFN